MLKYSYIKLLKCKGFTLIEALVSISIIALLTVLTVPHYQQSQNQITLQQSAYQLAQEIRKVQEMVLAAKKCEECAEPNKDKIPPGYGIYFNPSENKKFIIYADINDNKQYDSGENIKSIDIKKGTIIFSTNPGALDINFQPPGPEIKINNIDANNIGEIVLALENDNSKTKTIKINKAGLVEIKK